jgi:hypothetical protein
MWEPQTAHVPVQVTSSICSSRRIVYFTAPEGPDESGTVVVLRRTLRSPCESSAMVDEQATWKVAATDRGQCPAAVAGRAGGHQARASATADLPHPPRPARERPAHGVDRDRLRPAAGCRPPAARRADHAALRRPQHHTSAAMTAMIMARPWLTVYRPTPTSSTRSSRCGRT